MNKLSLHYTIRSSVHSFNVWYYIYTTMDIQVPGWQLSMIVGAGTFAGMSLYNRFTQDPEEINSTAYLMKSSAIADITVLIA